MTQHKRIYMYRQTYIHLEVKFAVLLLFNKQHDYLYMEVLPFLILEKHSFTYATADLTKTLLNSIPSEQIMLIIYYVIHTRFLHVLLFSWCHI